MKQYFLCPKCKKKLMHTGREQYYCSKCNIFYRVPNMQRYSMIFINLVMFTGLIIALTIGAIRIGLR